MNMKPIEKKSLASEVVEALTHRIKSGVYPLGTKLPVESILMSAYGVGRSTIREAIKILSNSGFVNVQQGIGTFVISHVANDELIDKIDQADFAEVYDVRQILELKIVERAAINRKEEHLIAMRKYLDERIQFATNGSFEDCVKADIRFHITVAESCGNSILAELYKTLSKHVAKFFKHVHKDASSFLESQEKHEDLYRYIKLQDAEKAVIIAQKIIKV